MAGGTGNSQSLPYRQPDKERKRYLAVTTSKSDTACVALLLFFCKILQTSIAELQENTEALKTKMSELRLYCDLLLQQVNKIKENDELGDTAEVRLRFGWADEIREAAVGVKLQCGVAHLQLARRRVDICLRLLTSTLFLILAL